MRRTTTEDMYDKSVVASRKPGRSRTPVQKRRCSSVLEQSRCTVLLCSGRAASSVLHAYTSLADTILLPLLALYFRPATKKKILSVFFTNAYRRYFSLMLILRGYKSMSEISVLV